MRFEVNFSDLLEKVSFFSGSVFIFLIKIEKLATGATYEAVRGSVRTFWGAGYTSFAANKAGRSVSLTVQLALAFCSGQTCDRHAVVFVDIINWGDVS